MLSKTLFFFLSSSSREARGYRGGDAGVTTGDLTQCCGVAWVALSI